MKILEICPYSAGGCGVWARAKQESLELIKLGHEVKVFSSYFEKGTDKIVPEFEEIEKLKIQRFPAKKLGGESFMKWDFEKQAIEFKPDVIIAHNYRHLHTTKALKIAKKINAKILLVTHAPFVEGNITRSKLQTTIVKIYDKFIGPRTLNKFDKILAISRWEIPYLQKIGAKQEKIVYIPNGIPEEFFQQNPTKYNAKKIMFLGRISEVKNIEVLIKAFELIKSKNITLEIIGPKEQPYTDSLKISKNIKVLEPIYDLNKKIKKLQEADIFVLPSKREAMPQSLIEAMSLGKLVISSKTQGGLEIISKNGFLFEIGNYNELFEILKFCLDKKNKEEIEKIRQKARTKSQEFKWSEIAKKLNKVIQEIKYNKSFKPIF